MRPQPRYNPGDRIGGRYRVHKALMGGMGEVYLCLDEQQMLPFALKTFQPRYFDSNALRKTFEEEVKSWIVLEKHSNIVQCHHMEFVENTPFVFLEWIAGHPGKGTSLREWLRHGPLDLKTALEVTIGILRGLRHADVKSPGIVHRDLKPDNILMLEDGTPKITDFGLAKSVGAAKDVSPDGDTESGGFGGSMRVGEVVGTPPYMPPEQWRGEMPDFRADVYAVGCILYEMLTGKMAFLVPEGVTTQSEYIQRMRELHSTGKRPQLPESIPTELNALVGNCLAPDTINRPESIVTLLDELAAVYEQQVGTPPPDEPPAGKLTKFEYGNRGVTFHNLKEYERAIADYDEAIRLDPTNALAYSNRGASYDNLGNPQRAIDDLDEAIRLDPTNAQAYSNRGTSYDNLGNPQRAIADYDEAIRLDPTYAPAYYNRGTSYHNLGDPQRAIADYDEAIRLDPTYATAYHNRGNSYEKLGNPQRAIADYDEAIRLDPTYATAYHNRGTSYHNLGDPQRAIADYDEAIRFNPTLATAYHNRGTSYEKLGNPQRAIADYDEAIRLDPTYAPAYYNRGTSYHNLGDPQRAIDDYDAAIRLDPTFAQAYSNRGVSYAKLGNPQRAIADYDEAIRLDPTDAQAYYNRGNSYLKMGNPQRAIDDYDEAIRLDPTFALAYSNRGTSYDKLGNPQRAIDDYDAAIRLDPTDAQAYANRGTSYHELGNVQRALADYDAAIRLDPTDAQAYVNKGALLARSGRLQEALPLFEKAAALGHPTGVQYAAMARRDLGLAPTQTQVDPNDPQAAFEAFQEAGSPDAMREAVAQFPVLAQMVPTITQAIQQQVPPEARPAFEQRLAWLKQLLNETQSSSDDPQAAFEAFQQASSPDAMRQAVQQFPVLAQLIPTIEQVIQTQVPPEARPAFEQRLAWLRQIVGEGGASAPNEQQQMEAAVQQLVGLYQQHGEAGLRQVLGQQGVPSDQIEQLIAVVKQASGEG